MQPCSYYALVVALHDLHLHFCRQCKTRCQTNQVFSLYFCTLLASQHATHHAAQTLSWTHESIYLGIFSHQHANVLASMLVPHVSLHMDWLLTRAGRSPETAQGQSDEVMVFSSKTSMVC